MNQNPRKLVLVVGLVFVALALMTSCSRTFDSGYGFKISSKAGQTTSFFECMYSTQTNTCTIAVQANPSAAVVTHTVAAGGSKTLENAPVGAQYCGSDTPQAWQTCSKFSVPDGTTTVESGTKIRR